jgi:hypothetical protein
VSDPAPARPGLVQRWEALESGQQAAIAFPVLVVVLSVLHLTVLGQPLVRGIGYGVFWAVPATVLLVVATAGEKRKRERERAARHGDEP